MSMIIAGFAGIGKTSLAKKYKNVIDIESSPYKWDYSNMNITDIEKVKGSVGRTVNPNFPSNYINKIKESIGIYDIILVWVHPEEILPLYEENNIDYVLCFPEMSAISIYEERFNKRGNSENYIRKVIDSYPERYKEFMENEHEKIILKGDETLEDALLKMGIALKL